MRATVFLSEDFGGGTSVWTASYDHSRFKSMNKILSVLRSHRLKAAKTVKAYLEKHGFVRYKSMSPTRIVCSAEFLVLWFNSAGTLSFVETLASCPKEE